MVRFRTGLAHVSWSPACRTDLQVALLKQLPLDSTPTPRFLIPFPHPRLLLPQIRSPAATPSERAFHTYNLSPSLIYPLAAVMDPDNNSTPLKFPTTLPHFDTEIKHSSQLDPFIVPATSTADTSVDRVKNINAYELRNSVFSTDQFSELYLDPLVTDEKLELVWKTATDAMGPSLLYDTRSRQWSNTATTNRNKPTEEQHVELLRRVQRVIQQQLGSDNVLSAFKNSGNVPLNGGEAIRKPDVFTVHRDATTTINGNNSTKYNWRQVRVIGELKQNQLCVGDEKGTNVSRAEMVITLSRYAREIFIQPGRR